MKHAKVIKALKESQRPIMLSESWNQQGFPYPVASERLLLNRKDEGNPMGSVLAMRDSDKGAYCVYENSFDYSGDSTRPTATFKEPVYNHILYFHDNLVALSKEDDQSLLSPNGERVAQFPFRVHPQVVELPKGRYASLGMNNLDISGINGEQFMSFKAKVHPQIVYEGEGRFASVLIGNQSVIIRNGPEKDIIGHFPFPEDGEVNRMVKVGGRYAGIPSRNKKLVVHSMRPGENEQIPYGKFPVDVDPKTLITEEHIFIALDEATYSKVYCMLLGTPDRGYGIEPLRNDLEIEGVDSSKCVWIAQPARLEELLK